MIQVKTLAGLQREWPHAALAVGIQLAAISTDHEKIVASMGDEGGAYDVKPSG